AATGEDVLQYGPGFLWEEIEQAWREYEEADRPDADQFGLTVTPRGHQVWLRNPELVVQPSRS
ncbi:methyltransferase domain-containing protein, partial [Streptomyces griseus]